MPVDGGGDQDVITEPLDPEWTPQEPSSHLGPEASSDFAPPTEGTTPSDVPLDDLEFDERHQQDFLGLLYIGALTHTFSWMGHHFTIRTLTTDELLEVGLATQSYDGTVGSGKAYVTAVVGAATVAVDGRPIYTPIGPDDNEVLKRFQYAKKHWYPATIDAIYNEVMALEARVNEILKRLGESSG